MGIHETFRRTTRNLRLGLLGASVAAMACQASPIEWIDGIAQATSQPSPLAQSPLTPIDSSMRVTDSMAQFLLTQDMLREAGAASLVAVHLDSMDESRADAELTGGTGMIPHNMAGHHMGDMGSDVAPNDPDRCARSLRVASAPGQGAVAVWWTRLDRGRVALMSAWRDSTAAGAGAWQGPMPVDTLDQGPRDVHAAERGAAGCSRPAPSVSFDARNGYVHVSYSLTGPEGTGVFYAHQMTRHVPFEPPLAVVYGDRVVASRIASEGELVAVAYEDPNARDRSSISLAVSRTAGHTFDDRLNVSSSTMSSRDPHVQVRGRAIVVGWSEFPGGDADPVFRIRRARLR